VPELEVLADRVSASVPRALEQHRAELAELVERQVELELERLTGELVAEALARRNGAGDTGEGHEADDVSRLDTPGGSNLPATVAAARLAGGCCRAPRSAATPVPPRDCGLAVTTAGGSASTPAPDAHDEPAARTRARLRRGPRAATRNLDRTPSASETGERL
jgi:hypothetical protein